MRSSGPRFDCSEMGAAIGVRPVPPSIRLSKLNSPLDGVEMPTPASSGTMLRMFSSGKVVPVRTGRLSGRAGRPAAATLLVEAVGVTSPLGSISWRGGRFTLVRTGAIVVGVGVSRLSPSAFDRISLVLEGRWVRFVRRLLRN